MNNKKHAEHRVCERKCINSEVQGITTENIANTEHNMKQIELNISTEEKIVNQIDKQLYSLKHIA